MQGGGSASSCTCGGWSGCWDLVEEPEHGLQAALAVGDRHVESDDGGFGVVRAELPGEPGLVVGGCRPGRPAGTGSRGTGPAPPRWWPRSPLGPRPRPAGRRSARPRCTARRRPGGGRWGRSRSRWRCSAAPGRRTCSSGCLLVIGRGSADAVADRCEEHHRGQVAPSITCQVVAQRRELQRGSRGSGRCGRARVPPAPAGTRRSERRPGESHRSLAAALYRPAPLSWTAVSSAKVTASRCPGTVAPGGYLAGKCRAGAFAATVVV